eukprot:6083609-Prymnesium_polylepis.2
MEGRSERIACRGPPTLHEPEARPDHSQTNQAGLRSGAAESHRATARPTHCPHREWFGTVIGPETDILRFSHSGMTRCSLDTLLFSTMTIRVVHVDQAGHVVAQAGGHAVTGCGLIVTAAHTFLRRPNGVRLLDAIRSGNKRILCLSSDGEYIFAADIVTGDDQLAARYSDGRFHDVA